MHFRSSSEFSTRRQTIALTATLVLSSGLSALPAYAATSYEVLVAPRDSAAYAAASAKVDNTTIFAERKIHAAFGRAQQLLAACGDCTVYVKIAAGTYDGKAGTGMWSFPDVQAPRATLRILGGYSDDFSSRAPFTSPTILQVNENRSNAVLQFEGKKHALRELVLSGLTIDTGPSNSYGVQENSLHKAGSSTFPQIAFGYLTTDLLVIADNVFMNAPNGVGGPLIRAMSPKAEVRVENNFFVNNVYTWVVGSGGGSHVTGRYLISGNSFVLNWPYNPDKTTSNPGTLEIGNNYSAAKVEIRGNLFAYNAGGAVFPQWDDNRGPKLAFVDNLFWKNGGLFGAASPGSGAVVGKFNGSATHAVFDMMDVEDDFTWETAGNVSTDPGLALVPPKLQGVAYEGTGRRGSGKPAGEPAQADAAPDSDTTTADMDELDRMMAELDALSEGGDAASGDETTAEAEESAADESALDFEDYAGEGAIKNFAPFLEYVPGELPFPTQSEAQAYGASADRVRQY